MSREDQGKVKARPKQGKWEFKARSRQHKHNLNSNNNLMGFDTFEINLVFPIFARFLLLIAEVSFPAQPQLNLT